MTENPLLDPDERCRRIEQALLKYEKNKRSQKYGPASKALTTNRKGVAAPRYTPPGRNKGGTLILSCQARRSVPGGKGQKPATVGNAVGKIGTYGEQYSNNSYLSSKMLGLRTQRPGKKDDERAPGDSKVNVSNLIKLTTTEVNRK